MSKPNPSNPPVPPSPESAPPMTTFDPNDPNRFRLTEEQKARVLGQARKVIQLQGGAVNPITPKPQAPAE